MLAVSSPCTTSWPVFGPSLSCLDSSNQDCSHLSARSAVGVGDLAEAGDASVPRLIWGRLMTVCWPCVLHRSQVASGSGLEARDGEEREMREVHEVRELDGVEGLSAHRTYQV